jgi:hypothetical protein
VGADLETLFVGGEGAGGGVLFLGGTAPAFVEGLYPQGFGGVSDRFWESVKCGGAGVQAGRKPLPPGIEQGVDGVRGAGAEFLADFLDGGALAGAQQGVGGALNVAGGDATRRLAIAVWTLGHFRSVAYNTSMYAVGFSTH